MPTYTKLFSTIITSTVWQESNAIRIVWITMLALRERDGTVMASIPGLASMAKVTIEECEEALNKFLAPDKYSRTKDHEGRRIEEVDGGWRILNADKYRELMNIEERREYNRLAKQRERAKKKPVNDGQRQSTTVNDGSALSAQSESESELITTTNINISSRSPSQKKLIREMSDDEYYKHLAEKKCYQGIDIHREVGKCETWCESNGANFSRKRLVNWLNRAEKPLAKTQIPKSSSLSLLTQARAQRAQHEGRLS